MTRAASFALLVALAGMAAGSAGVDVQAEREVLRRLDKAWAQAAAARDVEKTLSFWADNASVYPPGQPALVGKDAIRRYVLDAFALPGFSITWETTDFELSASGDVAYGVGTNLVTMQDAQGHAIKERGRGVTVWRKGADASWKCVLDIWNAEPPASPASR